MQTRLLLAITGLSALTVAQFENINPDAAIQAVEAEASFIVTLADNPTFIDNLVALATAIPDSVYSQASANPAAFANQLDTATTAPAWVTAIPTSVFNSLETILAKPAKIEEDLISLFNAPQASSIFANSAIPTSVRAALQTDPLGVIVDVLTEETIPQWAATVPTGLQSQVGSVVNQGLSTIIAGLGATSPTPTTGKPVFPTGSSAARTCSACPSCTPITVIVTVTAGSAPSSNRVSVAPSGSSSTSGFARSGTAITYAPGVPVSAPAGANIPSAVSSRPTGTGSAAVFNGTSTGAVRFTGAAAPMKTAAVGVAALFAGAGALMNA